MHSQVNFIELNFHECVKKSLLYRDVDKHDEET